MTIWFYDYLGDKKHRVIDFYEVFLFGADAQGILSVESPPYYESGFLAKDIKIAFRRYPCRN